MSTERTASVLVEGANVPPQKSLGVEAVDEAMDLLQALLLEVPKVQESRYPRWTGSRMPQLPPVAFASAKDPVFERVDSNILRRLTVLEGWVARILASGIHDGPDPPPFPLADGAPIYRRKRGKRGGKRRQVPTPETDDGICVD